MKRIYVCNMEMARCEAVYASSVMTRGAPCFFIVCSALQVLSLACCGVEGKLRSTLQLGIFSTTPGDLISDIQTPARSDPNQLNILCLRETSKTK